MSKEWIDQLAQDIRLKNKEAAAEYGRQQHYEGVIAVAGKEFFLATVLSLQEDVDALRRQLQGDATAAEMAMQTIKADEVKITRARFPWVDARLVHRDETITLEYAKGAGVAGDPALDRMTKAFVFRVAPDDAVYVEETFADSPRRYERAEDLARHVAEVLFAV